MKDLLVPGSDGAGVVEAVGSRVTHFKPGDRVVTLFSQAHLGGPVTPRGMSSGLGGLVDGVLRQYGAFDELGVVAIPDSLSFAEASALPCAAVTAWNVFNGLPGKQLRAGDTVLTQGTGGVSVFALQFAKAVGARVIATTSSAEKGERLKALGADHVLNYKETEDWGAKAKELTPGGEGVDHVIEVGGPKTMAQSLAAVKLEGVISVVGFLGGPKEEEEPSILETLRHVCIIRGIMVGSRVQHEEMNRAIEANGIKPVLDKEVFPLEKAREAYEYMWAQKHFGKLVISIA